MVGGRIITQTQNVLDRVARRGVADHKGEQGHGEEDEDEADEAPDQKNSHDPDPLYGITSTTEARRHRESTEGKGRMEREHEERSTPALMPSLRSRIAS